MQQLHIKSIHKVTVKKKQQFKRPCLKRLQEVLTDQELITPFSLCLLYVHPKLSQMLKTLSTLCSFPSPNLDRVFPPEKKIQRKGHSLFPFCLFILEPLLLPLPPSFFPPLDLESAPINLGNQLHKHSSQSQGELLSPHLLPCFTTKNPYGFMVGCKQPEPRPKMDQNIA